MKKNKIGNVLLIILLVWLGFKVQKVIRYNYLKEKAVKENMCFSGGKLYKQGVSYVDEDGCNFCKCPGPGNIVGGCTMKFCPIGETMSNIKNLLF